MRSDPTTPVPDEDLERAVRTRWNAGAGEGAAEPDGLRPTIGSELPAAERFERRIFEDMLPTIRRNDDYGVGGA